MNLKKHIPNLLTCANLLCGCFAIVNAFHGNLVMSAYLVGIAAIFDFFDGFVARALKVGGEMGKQLDSLADMVTFGVVPGVVMYLLIHNALINKMDVLFPMGDYPRYYARLLDYLPFSGFLISVFSGLRLAKFNIDARQTDSFIGVPTPANTILICSLILIVKQNWGMGEHASPFGLFLADLVNSNYYFLVGLTLVMSYLLVAEIPLFALKFKNFGWTDNKIRYLFLIISVVLLILFQFIAIPFTVVLYIVLSILNNVLSKNKIPSKISK